MIVKNKRQLKHINEKHKFSRTPPTGTSSSITDTLFGPSRNLHIFCINIPSV